MATIQLGEEVAHALIRNLAGNDNIPDRNSIRGWAPSLWLGWVKIRPSQRKKLECAPLAGQVEAEELTGSAGLSKDESHEQAAFP